MKPDPRDLSRSRARVAGVAPAKLNLFLEVLGKRADGYHELRTVFHEIDLADEIAVELRPNAAADSIALTGLPIDGPPESNLALRAAAAFRRQVADCPPIHVELTKHVPLGSGMGGGSADAAFVLRAMRALVGRSADGAALSAAARDVGADVAYFLAGGTALGCGRGDELTSIAVADPLVFLLALPRFSLSTTMVYGHVDLIEPRADVSSFVEGMRRRLAGMPVSGCFNRLEAAASKVDSRVGAHLAELRSATDAPWTMTGSGSALFAPMRSAAEAEAVARRVIREYPLDRRELSLRDLRIVRSYSGSPGGARL